MRRRDFIVGLGGAMALPFTARAQQKVPRVGVLLVMGAEVMGPYRATLRELGYVDGKTIALEIRSAEGKVERLPELAAELVRSKVDVIVASLTPAVTAAKNATSTIPIVMAPAGDPVGTGLVASLARPGGNITGVSGAGPELYVKNLELIRDIVPSARRVAVLASAPDPFTEPFLKEIRENARTAQIEIIEALIPDNDGLPAAFDMMVRQRAEAIIIQGSLAMQNTVDLALKHRLPAFSNQRAFARAGTLAAYGASFDERGREIAGYIDRILKGTKPADLPVQQPTKFELTVNLKTAATLGITVPQALLARADEVIE